MILKLFSLYLLLIIDSYYYHFIQFSRCRRRVAFLSSLIRALRQNVAFGDFGGDKRDRTADPLLAKQVLSQLSYTPISLMPNPF